MKKPVAIDRTGSFVHAAWLRRFTAFARPWPAVAAAAVLGAALLACAAGIHGCAVRRPNVILITMATTRFDHLGCYGYALASTPALDSLSRTSTLFETAIAASPLTLASHTTILTGRTPLGHGIRENGWHGMTPGVRTLAEVLADQGYTTAAFVSSEKLGSNYDLARGFQFYYDDFFLQSGERGASDTTDRVIAYLEGAPKSPLFLWVHYYDPHDPYEPPEPFSSATRGSAYDAEISAMDHGIGRLLAALDRSGYADDAHIILVADHGEGLGERDGYTTHGLLLTREQVRVPLLWHTPGQRTGRRDASLAGCVDIFPTALDALGIECPETEGISLVPQLEGKRGTARDGLYCETIAPYVDYGWSPSFAWRTADQKYIANSRPRFYDLKQDPDEMRNLIAQDPVPAQRLRRQLQSYIERWTPSSANTAGPLSEEERTTLEGLGYVDAARAQWTAEHVRVPPLDALDGLANPRTHVAARDLFTDMLKARDAGDWHRVIEICRAILKKLPDSPAVPLRMAEALLRLGRPDDALVWLKRGLRYRPGDERAARWMADALLMTAQYARASSIYATLPAKEADAELHLARVRAAVMSGDYAQARECLRPMKEAFAIMPQIAPYDRAIETLSRAGTERPAESDSAFARQMGALLDLGLPAEAAILLSACEDARPDSLVARLRGDIAFARQDWCAARDAYARALSLGARPSPVRRTSAGRFCDEAGRETGRPAAKRPRGT